MDLEFRKFSDQLRLHSSASLAPPLSIGESIWSDRRGRSNSGGDDGWKSAAKQQPFLNAAPALKLPLDLGVRYNNDESVALPGALKAGNLVNEFKSSELYSSSAKINGNGNSNSVFGFYGGGVKNYFANPASRPANNSNVSNLGGAHGKKNVDAVGKKKSNGVGGNNSSNNNSAAVDKRFKTLPPSEALPRSEAIGGYIFVCNNETMEENLKRELFGLPSRYRDSVRAIRPGLPLFLYNYSTHQLHGIFEAASFGGTNIDPTAWEDKKCPGESRFPAQVRVVTRKICDPLEEDAFRPILHHYDGPKFRLELSVPETISLLDVFEDQSTA